MTRTEHGIVVLMHPHALRKLFIAPAGHGKRLPAKLLNGAKRMPDLHHAQLFTVMQHADRDAVAVYDAHMRGGKLRGAVQQMETIAQEL